jgi:hypothetical protein
MTDNRMNHITCAHMLRDSIGERHAFVSHVRKLAAGNHIGMHR